MSETFKLVGEKKIIQDGWVLVMGHLIWGIIPPESPAHVATQGWTDDVNAILLAEREAMPPCKWWFTHHGDPVIVQMLKGEWVRMRVRKSTMITTLI